MPDELPVAFSRRDASRIAATVRRSEAAYRNTAPEGTRGDRQWRHHVRGILTEELDRGTLATPTYAAIDVLVFDGEAWEVGDESFDIQDNGLLPADTTLAVGTQVEASFVCGVWCLSAFDCDLEDVS